MEMLLQIYNWIFKHRWHTWIPFTSVYPETITLGYVRRWQADLEVCKNLSCCKVRVAKIHVNGVLKFPLTSLENRE